MAGNSLMKLRVVLSVLALALAALAAGCAKAPVTPAPKRVRTQPAKPAFRATVSPARNATDAASVKYFLDIVKTSSDATSVRDDTAARRLFPKARFPRDTLGRKLLAITVAGYVDSFSAQRTLTLIYENGLTVNETVYNSGKPLSMPRPPGADVATVGTGVATFSTYWGGQVAPRLARLEWETNGIYMLIDWPGATKEQLLTVARSMAP